MNNTDFAQELHTKRIASGLSQGQLASLIHLSRHSINRFENGKANASEKTKNVILRCLNYYICDKPFTLLIDYLSIRFQTTDVKAVMRKILGMKVEYFFHFDYGYYGYKEHYAYGDIKVFASDNENMGVFLEMKGAGCRNLEHVLQAQDRDWYAFLHRCIECGGVIKRFDLAVNDMSGLLDISALYEKYNNGEVDGHARKYRGVHSGKLSGNNRDKGKTLYIGSQDSPLYFCLYEKDKEQATKHQHTDIKNRFEIRLRKRKAVQAVEELLLIQNTVDLVFSIINSFVYFPDYPLWDIFVEHEDLPLEIKPQPVNIDRTLKWLERQVIPSVLMLEEIDRLTGSTTMKDMIEQSVLTEKHEMMIKQLTTDIKEVIEDKGVFYE